MMRTVRGCDEGEARIDGQAGDRPEVPPPAKDHDNHGHGHGHLGRPVHGDAHHHAGQAPGARDPACCPPIRSLHGLYGTLSKETRQCRRADPGGN